MSAPPLTRREKQRRTRDALLAAAAVLFAERGLEPTSVDQIAQAAGYTKGAFYANFASKEELFLVMLEERFGRELERLDRALAGTGAPQVEARAAALEFVHSAFDRTWSRLYFQFAAHAARSEAFRVQLAGHHADMRRRLAAILERWRTGYGVEMPVAADRAAAMLCAMADGFLVDRLIDPSAAGPELFAEMVGVFLSGLEAQAAAALSAAPTRRARRGSS